ncbi:MAG: ABC transporter ATP-binding protein [Alphaproteobacteria bacterium]|nr:ABC transporter ATP-binding protein [Alphaproteobacteria bacterium]
MAVVARGLRLVLGRRVVLDGVDVAVADGAVTALVGANGAGKSTLLRLLAGIDAPDGGDVTLDDAPLRQFEPAARARQIAFLPQQAQPQWPICGRDVVSLGRLPHGAGFDRESPADTLAIDRAMTRTGTAAFAQRRIDRLSAGERARLLLARALATEAKVLLADEPTAALDPGYQLDAMTALRDEAGRGVAVAVALHDLALAARFCDRLVLMAAGRVVTAGTPAEVLQVDALRAAYGVAFELVAFGDLRLPVPVSRTARPGGGAPP